MLPRRFYFDNALDDLFEEEGARMKCDIYEKDNTYHVDMDLPGFKKEEIKVECNKGNLIVSAEKKHEEEEKDEKKKYLRRERVYGKYSRSFYLGHHIIMVLYILLFQRLMKIKIENLLILNNN